jgi:hypothetical protein
MHDRILYRLTWLAAALSLGHHLDHLLRGNAVGWPLSEEVNAFTVTCVYETRRWASNARPGTPPGRRRAWEQAMTDTAPWWCRAAGRPAPAQRRSRGRWGWSGPGWGCGWVQLGLAGPQGTVVVSAVEDQCLTPPTHAGWPGGGGLAADAMWRLGQPVVEPRQRLKGCELPTPSPRNRTCRSTGRRLCSPPGEFGRTRRSM